MTEKKRDSYGNVAHALNVLLLFKREEECTLGEMAELLNLRKSYLLKLLADLKDKKFLTQDPHTGKYRLGLSCLELGTAFEDRLDIRRVARPYLEELSSSTSELVHLGVLDSDVVVLLERIMNHEVGRGMHLKFHLSLTSPPHTTAIGNVLLAFSDPKITNHYLLVENLKAFTPYTIADPSKVQAELEMARKQGYYLAYETFESGISGLAAPIFSKTGNVVAAMSICAPTVRILENKQAFKDMLLKQALKVSNELGYVSLKAST